VTLGGKHASPPAASRPAPWSTFLGQWLVGFVLLFAAIGMWTVATPKYAAPDEPAQAVKAAGTARLEIGRDVSAPGSPSVLFTIPTTIAAGTNPQCFAFKNSTPASCATPWRYVAGLVANQSSYVGHYPPLYYFLVGAPSLVTQSANVLLYMRVVSGLLSAVFLSAAFVLVARTFRSRWALLGIGTAITPMVYFLAAVINPSGLEITSAICLWAAGGCLVLGAGRVDQRLLISWGALSASVCVLTRGLSPLMVVLIGVALVALAGRDRLRTLVARRDMQVGLAVVVVSGLAAVGWILTEKALSVQTSANPVAGEGRREILLQSWRIALKLNEMVGYFGWLDTPMPTWVYVTWGLLIVALVLLVILQRQVRVVLVLCFVAVCTLAIPTMLAYDQAHKEGIVGQGRYIMPLALGLPIIAGLAGSRRLGGKRAHNASRSWAMVTALAILVVQQTCFVLALARNRTGIRHSVFVLHAPWEPPVPWLVLILVFPLVQIALAVWCARMGAPRREVHDDLPSTTAVMA